MTTQPMHKGAIAALFIKKAYDEANKIKGGFPSQKEVISVMKGMSWDRMYSSKVLELSNQLFYGKNNFYGKGVTYEVKDISDRGYQKDFCKWSPNMNKLNNYLYYLLDRQFDKNNPDINKALMYFQ